MKRRSCVPKLVTGRLAKAKKVVARAGDSVREQFDDNSFRLLESDGHIQLRKQFHNVMLSAGTFGWRTDRKGIAQMQTFSSHCDLACICRVEKQVQAHGQPARSSMATVNSLTHFLTAAAVRLRYNGSGVLSCTRNQPRHKIIRARESQPIFSFGWEPFANSQHSQSWFSPSSTMNPPHRYTRCRPSTPGSFDR